MWASKEINSKKANRTPQEAGLPVPKPTEPKDIPVSATIANPHRVPDWQRFGVGSPV